MSVSKYSFNNLIYVSACGDTVALTVKNYMQQLTTQLADSYVVISHKIFKFKIAIQAKELKQGVFWVSVVIACICIHLLANLCFIFFIYNRSLSCNTNFVALHQMHLFSLLHNHLYMDSLAYKVLHNPEAAAHVGYPNLSEPSLEPDIRAISHTS